MIRFVDLREADIGERFAWWDTITDRFIEYAGYQAWYDMHEFMDDHTDGVLNYELDRFKRLAPEWTFSGREP